jgi:hypothetical protein
MRIADVFKTRAVLHEEEGVGELHQVHPLRLYGRL